LWTDSSRAAAAVSSGVPRSALLAAWLRAWRAGLASFDELVDHFADPGIEETAEDLPGQLVPAPLRTALSAFATVPAARIRVVLPAAGDPRGLPGPGPFTSAALAAGEAVVCGDTGLVPRIETRRSGSGDHWEVITWRGYPVPAAPPDPLTVPEAEHDLLLALRESADALIRLDVARWRPELAGALTGLRNAEPESALPPGYGPRCHRVLAKAVTVSQILELAAGDAPGGAVTAWEAAERDAALRPLAVAARRALVSAVNAPL
jgi:hypothetical protein